MVFFPLTKKKKKHDGPKINSIWNLYTRDVMPLLPHSRRSNTSSTANMCHRLFSNISVLYPLYVFSFSSAREFLEKLKFYFFILRLFPIGSVSIVASDYLCSYARQRIQSVFQLNNSRIFFIGMKNSRWNFQTKIASIQMEWGWRERRIVRS